MAEALIFSPLFGLLVVVVINTILILRGLEKIHQEMEHEFTDHGSADGDEPIQHRDGDIALRD